MQAIAIIGIGCRFPGRSSNPEAFWNLLKKGKDAIINVPENRWDSRRFYDPDPERPAKMHTQKGGFLQEPIDRFDPLFFGISPKEAEGMDPQQRILLEVAWEAIFNLFIISHQFLRGFTEFRRKSLSHNLLLKGRI